MRRKAPNIARESSIIAPASKKGALMVNQATIVATDVTATNGVIHVIDEVIIPGS